MRFTFSVLLAVSLAMIGVGIHDAFAQPVDAGAEVLQDAGSASAPAPTATPADKLHDPAAHPAAAWDDLKAAKKVGWPLAVFAGLLMACKLLKRAQKYKLAAFLSKGKMPVLVGMVGALALACFNAAADGGAWTAVFVAGVTALAHYRDADPTTPEPDGQGPA